MILVLLFLAVILLWIMRSLVICSMGPDWYIERYHSDNLKKTDRIITGVKVIGLVFLAFIQPVMFAAGSVASFFLYCFVLRSTVHEIYAEYLAALKAVKQEEEAKGTGSA